ncbi:MAG: hypothetical protein O7E54_06475 [Planctomycetota bacterium]|nr:hypothetical protein [Planctomycetota bacterium]
MRFIAVVLVLGAIGFGDTLEMKDGRLLSGTYMGGSQNTIRFKAKGQTMTLPVQDVIALTLERKGGGTAPTPPPTQPAGSGVTVMAGTPLLIRTKDLIDSSRHKSGHKFTGVLEFDLVVNKQLVAKKGTKVYGVLTQVKKGGRLRRRAELHLGLTTIAINNQPVKIQTGGYALKGEKQGTGKKVVGGAVIGGLYRGDKKGRRRGAAIGLTAAALSSKQIRVPPGTLMEFQLKVPFTVQ